MRKRKFITLLSVVLIASVALFTGLAQAQGLVPDNTCKLVKEDGTVEDTYSLTRIPVAGVPLDAPLGAKQTWSYTMEGFTGTGTQAAFVVDDVAEYLFPSGETTWEDHSLPAQDLSRNWDGFGQWASYSPKKLLTFPSIGDPTFEFYTDKVLQPTWIYVQLKRGKDLLSCSISGPGQESAPPLLSSLHSVCENILTGFDNVTGTNVPLETPFSVLTTVDSARCSIEVYRHDGLNCADATPETIEVSNMALTFGSAQFASLECGSENQQCPICELRGQRNPCSYTKYSGGRAYTICYNCSTGKRVDCITGL